MRRLPICLLCILAFAPRPASAGDKLPPDLALVPPDGLLFLHVRVQDIYKSEHFKEWRETLNFAGAKALAAFDSRFVPAPFSVERVTAFVPKNSFEPIVVISTSKAIDRAAFLKFTIPDAKEEKGTFGSLYIYQRKNLAFHFANDRTLLAGPPGAVRGFLENETKAKSGNLSDSLKQANSGHAAVLAVNFEAIPAPLRDLAVQQAPPAFRPVLEPAVKARLATATLDLRKEGQLDVRLLFANAKLADEGQIAAREGIKMARAFLGQKRAELKNRVSNGNPDVERLAETALTTFSLGMLNRFDDYLAGEPVKKQGNSLVLSVKIPKDSQAAVLASAASLGFFSSLSFSNSNTKPIATTRPPRPAMTAAQVQSSNNLKQVALALHSYHDVYKKFPAAAITDKKGKPLLSWRVAILPYLEQDALYREFKLDEPWDSTHNKKLIERMPDVYKLYATKSKTPAGETHYLVFVGNDDPNNHTAFGLATGLTMTSITDGTSNTILCVEASKSVPWTKPEDITYDAKKPLPNPPDFYGRGVFMAAFCDGAVHALRSKMNEAAMRAFITRDGGEIVDLPD